MNDHLNLKLLIFVGILQVLNFDFKKLRISEFLNFHPWKICIKAYSFNLLYTIAIHFRALQFNLIAF